MKLRIVILVSVFGWLSCSANPDPKIIALSRDPALGKITVTNGVYGPTCRNRTGNWSLGSDERCDAPSFPSLSVEPGDINCTLTVTSVEIDCETYHTRGMDLEGNYKRYGYAFVKEGECDPAFYANALVSDPSYVSDFVLKVIYSKNFKDVSANSIATFDTVSAYYLDTQVPAPDYVLDTKNLKIQVDISKRVTQVSGEISLYPGTRQGEYYVLLDSALANNQRNFRDVHAFFQTMPKIPVNVPIPASALKLEGELLKTNPATQRSIIVVHTERDVSSYEVITFTILPPS